MAQEGDMRQDDERGGPEPFGGWPDGTPGAVRPPRFPNQESDENGDRSAGDDFGSAHSGAHIGATLGDAAVALAVLRGASPSWHPADRLPSLRVPAVRQAIEAVMAPFGIASLADASACSTDTVSLDSVAAIVSAAEAASGQGEPIGDGALGDARLIHWRGVHLVVLRDAQGRPAHVVGPAYVAPSTASPPEAKKKRRSRRRTPRATAGPRPRWGGRTTP